MRSLRVKQSVSNMWLPGFTPEELTDHETRIHKGSVAVATVKATQPIVVFPFHAADVGISEPVVVAERPVWRALTQNDFSGLNGQVAKFQANIKAIELVRSLRNEGRTCSEDEAIILSRYTGWGGLPQAFNLDHDDLNWKARADQLKGMLSDTEYESCRSSTNNAHYSPIEVIEAMWSALERFGFKGGKIIEPGCGLGYFIGAMPQHLAKASQVTGIEIDNMTASMTSAVYGSYGVRVVNEGFEKFKAPDNFFDLAIGNVPFGNYQVPDTSGKPYSNFLIHDYFFCRALDLVRPGGLVAFITSTGTLDKNDNAVRRYLRSKADLVGAIRLPVGTFQEMAGTKVATDILFLKKRNANQLPADLPKWETIDVADPALVKPVVNSWNRQQHFVNEYFNSNPVMLIGRLEFQSNGFNKNTTMPVFDGNDLPAEIKACVERLPADIYKAAVVKKAQSETREFLPVSSGTVKPGGFIVLDDGRIGIGTGDDRVEVMGFAATKSSRIAGMVMVRDAARDLLRYQALSSDDTRLGAFQVALSVAYDTFVSKHGYLHERANRQAFRTDPDFPLLLSLEKFDDESGTAEKTDIFTMRTVGLQKQVDRCETATEAMAISIHDRGHVDPRLMEKLMGVPQAQILEELSHDMLVFQDPETLDWIPNDEYLSGNVRKKLLIAESQTPQTGFERNIQALKDVIPDDLEPGEIAARLGSTWIPSSDYTEFLNLMLQGEDGEVQFSKRSGTWTVNPDYRIKFSVANTQIFGTSRISGVKLMEMALNQQVPTIKDRDPMTDKYYVNKDATLIAREKQSELREKFREWIFSDAGRTQRLTRKYNDEFNAVRLREFNGSHLQLPGFSKSIKLHKHQLDAIWRGVVGGPTLLAHEVGAGKTLVMICIGMELRRLGLVNKPCYACPNHMLEQFAQEFLRAYPGANILMATKDDLVGDKRRELLSRIATGNWDAVLLTHASFERIKMSDDLMFDFIDKQIAELTNAVMELKSDKSDSKIIKELEAQKKRWIARLEKLSAKSKKDDLLTFEQLGIDLCVVDEIHLFKNLYRFTKMTRVAGLPNSNSERAFDLWVKSLYVNQMHGWKRGLIGATGTPVSNSMAEMWVMQKYFQNPTLEDHGLHMFDAWASNFGETVTALEIAPDGSGYRMNSRFSRFINLPELLTMFRGFADVKTAEMLNLPVPARIDKTISSKASPELVAYVQTLVERAETVRNGGCTPDVDNFLKITNDGRKAALDMRLIDRNMPMDPYGKVSLCTENVFQIWEATTNIKGTQLVFCDLSTPNNDGRFSVYHEIRAGLVLRGVPEAEIAFIHDFDSDAKKEELFRSVRDGRVRVLLGSTFKMGVGTNVQTLLCALHHIDAPWRPSDLSQRDGRAIRQGNTLSEVSVFKYVTQGSFDSYSWQTLEAKARFIAQIWRGDTGLRSVEDVELAALSFAEIKAIASGNPMVLEKAGVDGEIVKLSALKTSYMNQKYQNQYEVSALPGRISTTEQVISEMRDDLQMRVDVRGNSFQMVIQGQTFTDRNDAGEVLERWMVEGKKAKMARVGKEQVKIGLFAGYSLFLVIPIFGDPCFALGGKRLYMTGSANTALGCVRTLEHAANSIEDRIEEAETTLMQHKKRLTDLHAELDKPFDREERLMELIVRQREIDAALDLDKNQAGAASSEDVGEDVDILD